MAIFPLLDVMMSYMEFSWEVWLQKIRCRKMSRTTNLFHTSSGSTRLNKSYCELWFCHIIINLKYSRHLFKGRITLLSTTVLNWRQSKDHCSDTVFSVLCSGYFSVSNMRVEILCWAKLLCLQMCLQETKSALFLYCHTPRLPVSSLQHSGFSSSVTVN